LQARKRPGHEIRDSVSRRGSADRGPSSDRRPDSVSPTVLVQVAVSARLSSVFAAAGHDSGVQRAAAGLPAPHLGLPAVRGVQVDAPPAGTKRRAGR
jgi:hypothetical protein